MTAPWNELLRHRAFPEVAEAIRSRTQEIAQVWAQAMRQGRPELNRLSQAELHDSLEMILPAIADALASTDPADIRDVVERSPRQGAARFHQEYDLVQLMDEDRLLRGVIVENVEAQLGRQLRVPEAASLHATIDIMLQQSVLALVEKQKEELRRASEVELKYLSFLSHDLKNNLQGVAMSLELIKRAMAGKPGFSEEVDTIEVAQETIANTVGGMRRLLEHERLRHEESESKSNVVRLHELVVDLVKRFAVDAEKKGLVLAVDVEPGTMIFSDPEMIALVLQNLLGNAVTYSSKGTVKVGAKLLSDQHGRRWMLWVSDEGPGISLEQQGKLFQAFQRGATFGQEGVGLGLAIALQATRLLRGELKVESELGKGSRLSLILPEQQE